MHYLFGSHLSGYTYISTTSEHETKDVIEQRLDLDLDGGSEAMDEVQP